MDGPGMTRDDQRWLMRFARVPHRAQKNGRIAGWPFFWGGRAVRSGNFRSDIDLNFEQIHYADSHLLLTRKLEKGTEVKTLGFQNEYVYNCVRDTFVPFWRKLCWLFRVCPENFMSFGERKSRYNYFDILKTWWVIHVYILL